MSLHDADGLKKWEVVDHFILQNVAGIGGTFTAADVQRWADGQGWTVKASRCLVAHREAVERRVFTTRRIGMGQAAYYELVETATSVASTAVLKMHHQQAKETVSRWGREYATRMTRVANRHKKAAAALTQAEAEMKAVATILHVRLTALEDEDDEA